MSKKEKLIAEAQKLLQKGQLDKAIKAYQEAVALESGDLKTRQRLAELLSRAERLDESRAEFEVIGKSLAGNGFFLKAIAVYKQIEKLFPEDVSITLILASLNEKHGLTAQAMTEYKKAFDYYEKLGIMVEGIKVLEAMQKTDPQNINIRLKQAEVLYKLDRHEDSLHVFSSLAGLLVERRDDAAFARLAARIKELFPQNSDFVYDVILQEIESGNAEQAVQGLHALLKNDPRNIKVWTLVVMAYDRLGEKAKLKAASQHFLRFFPDAFLPKKHLASCLILEGDVDGAFSIMESGERAFIDANAASDLKELYASLLALAPYDVRVLKGMARICSLTGDKEQADAISSKIVALSNIAVKSQQEEQPVEPAPGMISAEEALSNILDDVESFAQEPEPLVEEQPTAVLPSVLELEEEILSYGDIQLDVASDEPPSSMVEPLQEQSVSSDLYEIEIELDMDDEPLKAQITGDENWFDNVSDIFENIATTPGKVKFAAGADSGDSQSHLDLGMAFREMGLLDEAINEFRAAAEDPARRVQCLIQQAGCLRDKGEPQLAESVLNSLLAAPGLTVEEESAIKLELGLTQDAVGIAPDAAGFDLFDEDDLEGFDLK